MLGLLAGKTLGGPGLNLDLGGGDGPQAILAAFKFVRQVKAVGEVGAISGLSQRQLFLDLRLQLGFEVFRVSVGQGAVAARVGVNFGPSRLTVPKRLSWFSRATCSTWTKTASNSWAKRLRKVARVSWSGWLLAAMKRNAKESYVARSILRLEKQPVAYP